MKFLNSLLSACILFSLFACQQQSKELPTNQNNTIVLLIRHAEKATDAPDSPLTDEGSKRANSLQMVLEHSQIKAIYSSQFKRNIDTVKPLAEQIGVEVTTIPVDLNNPQQFSESIIKEIIEKHKGETILIISHTNTIPIMIDLLLERKVDVKKIEYSDFFLVNIPNKGTRTLIKTQYGK